MTGGGEGIVSRVIGACARHRALTIMAVAAATFWGVHAMRAAPLDAIPDLGDVQVIVTTEWPGRSPDLIEDQITYPLSSRLLSAPNVAYVRGQSDFGVSFLYVVFDEGTDLYWARSRVLEYLSGAQASLPSGVTPEIGPDATGVGWVFQYALVDRTGERDLADLRTLQDWTLRYALASVPGVAEVASVGGAIREYQILVDPVKLLALQVSVAEVVTAVRDSNQDSGGRLLDLAGHEVVIRGRGYVTGPDDLRRIPVRTTPRGAPVTVGDVAEVVVGAAMQRGIAELDGEGETVGGIVVMRLGQNALDVIDRVKSRIDEVRPGLPAGVELVVAYDRSELILRAIDTLRRTLVEEMVVVAAVIIVFLLHVRSALIPILTIPVGVAIAFIPMQQQQLTANIMSLGGIAIAIGAMVDASIILVENVHRRLESWEAGGRAEPRSQVVLHAMQEVGPSVFFSLLVVTVSFLPIFMLGGQSGRLFSPLAFTKTYAMAAAALLSVTLTPAIAATLIRGRIRPERENPVNRWLVHAYEPVVRFALRRRYALIAASVLALLATVPAFLRLGSEFMPPLDEGTLLYMPTGTPGTSVTAAAELLQRMDRELMAFPEVERVFGKIGRADSATDPAPFSMIETTITLRPHDRWRPGLTFRDLVAEMDETLRYPGMPNLFWMPIQTRTEMQATGIRSQLGIKVFGPDLSAIEAAAIAVERTLSQLPQTRSAVAERTTGGFFLDVSVDRDRAARLGLRVADVAQVVETALGGESIGETVEGRERYPIQVRYARDFRQDPDSLARMLVAAPGGAQVPLSQVADVRFATGAPMIRSEDGQLLGLVSVDVGDASLVDYVDRAREAVARDVALPDGVRLAWAGQYEAFERARSQLLVVVPFTLVLVALLLFVNTGSIVETLLILGLVPFSLIGAVWLLYLLGYHLSVAVWVGIIALAGLDAQNGVVMMLYLRLVHARRAAQGRMESFDDLAEAVVEGAADRIRPKLMTVLTMIVGLAPLLWSTGTGADVMTRIAAPMIGGLVTSFGVELLVYPALYVVWKQRSLPGGGRRPVAA